MKIRVISDAVCNGIFRDLPKIDNIKFDVSFAPVDQFVPEILKSENHDFLIIHLTQYAFNSYSINNNYLVALQEILKTLKVCIKKNKIKVILNTIYFNDLPFDQSEFISNQEMILKCNSLMLEIAKDSPSDILLVDVAQIISRYGASDNLNLRNYSVMRSPYSKKLSLAIKEEYILHLKNYFSPRIKVLLLDADNTLWGGVIGEDGVDGVKINHEYPGSIYYYFQQNLIRLKESGMILCLVTKNNLFDIEEIFNERDMPLSIDDFVEIKANWEPKSKNIEELLISLNVGASSVIFIDDNPFEIEEVQRVHTEMSCIRFDINNFEKQFDELYKSSGLYAHNLTDEDKIKTESYIQEKQRKINMQESSSIEDYLSSLDMEISIFHNKNEHIPRISQLTQKTNQFNLTTKRSSVSDIENFFMNGSVYSFSVKDRFGDMGIVGVVIIDKENKIDTFLLSCRAFGRHIEKAMLSEALKDNNKYPIFSSYIASSKNKMTEEFYKENGFLEESNNNNGNFKTYFIEKAVKCDIDFYGEIKWI